MPILMTRPTTTAQIDQRLANFSGVPTTACRPVPSFELRAVAQAASRQHPQITCLKVRFDDHDHLISVSASGTSSGDAVGDDLQADAEAVAEWLTQAVAAETPAWLFSSDHETWLYLHEAPGDCILLYED